MSCNFSTALQQRAKRWSAQRKCQVVLTEDVERMWRIAKPLSGKGKLTWLEAEWVTKKIGPRIFPFWWWPFYGTGQVASVPRPPHRARHNAKLGPIGTRPAGRCFSASLCWRLRGNSQGLSIHTLSKRAGGFIHWCSTMLERYAEKLGWYVDLP